MYLFFEVLIILMYANAKDETLIPHDDDDDEVGVIKLCEYALNVIS